MTAKTETAAPRPDLPVWRSLLYVPANNRRFIDKAHTRGADAIILVLVDLPDADVEAAPMHNVIPRLSDTPGTFRQPAPGLGEHTSALLAELGIAEQRQAELRERGVI